MVKSFNTTLKNIMPNARHVTCFAHIIALVGECYRVGFKDVDRIVSSIKFIFAKATQRRRRYIFHLKQSGLKAILPPTPVIVRWNTWFEAVKYDAEYWDHMKSFVKLELETQVETEKLLELEESMLNNTTRQGSAKFKEIQSQSNKAIQNLTFLFQFPFV